MRLPVEIVVTRNANVPTGSLHFSRRCNGAHLLSQMIMNIDVKVQARLKLIVCPSIHSHLRASMLTFSQAQVRHSALSMNLIRSLECTRSLEGRKMTRPPDR